jgi:hypothetical protein
MTKKALYIDPNTTSTFRIGNAIITVEPVPYEFLQRTTHTVTVEFEITNDSPTELDIAQELVDIAKHINAIHDAKDFLLKAIRT